MSRYRCIVKYGHAGSGKYTERAYYVWATDLLDAMVKVKGYRGVKKGNLFKNAGSVLQVERMGS